MPAGAGRTTTRAPFVGLPVDDMSILTRLNTMAIMAAVAATLAVLALTAQPAKAAPRVGPLVGIGEQQPEMFASPLWKRLQARDARYIAPWDALDDARQLALLDRWMDAARRERVRVVLGFAHSLRTEKLAHTLPTPRQFERQFKRFRARYPWVRDWVAWNEANHPAALTATRPRRAAQYFDAVSRNCRGCRVAAADLLDVSNMSGWLIRFRRYVHHRPRIWGLHNYGDANGLKVKSTPKLLALTKGQIWFTETGGLVLRRDYRGKKPIRTYRYGIKRAAASTQHALKLSCLSRRITRIYLYHWQQPWKVTSWDSGLVDRRGRARPAFYTVQRWVRRSAAASRSGGRRALCGTGVVRGR
jgi:hypothetical protein